MNEAVGSLIWINGAVVQARLEGRVVMSEQVWVGQDRLAAEVITLDPGVATIQVYEDTTGLHIGEPLYGTGELFSATLGPGILGNTFDGIQRPLDLLHERVGITIQRGQNVPPLDTTRGWEFSPQVAEGDQLEPGDLLGVVPETPLIEHRVLVPPGVRGQLEHLVEEGEYTVEDEIALIIDDQEQEHSLTMAQRWPVRRARPIRQRLSPTVPLISGQRVVDTFFPIAKGGTAAVPGPFGSGKTVLQHNLAKWSDADIIVYVGCGERGNEMAEVLEDFPKLEDPWSGRPLMERTVLVANTSNMPVAARESSIYTGVTIAEYYRDQGYDVALMADSTSRWAEALREISGRLEEMPAEEGFPAYLPSRLAAFYERAGRVETLGEREGSVTLIGAVSPPGGDFSEPVTHNTQRFTRCWWALSRELANARHYPSVDWLDSYSLYLEQVSDWWRERVESLAEDGAESGAADEAESEMGSPSEAVWQNLRFEAMRVLQDESDLRQLVELVGPDALADQQQWILIIARLLREGFLQQNAFHEVDAYTVPRKQILLLHFFVQLHQRGRDLLKQGLPLDQIREVLDIPGLIRLKEDVPNDESEQIKQRQAELWQKLESLPGEFDDLLQPGI